MSNENVFGYRGRVLIAPVVRMPSIMGFVEKRLSLLDNCASCSYQQVRSNLCY